MSKPFTYGLTHLAIAVTDLQRTKVFYQAVFDMQVMYDTKDFLQLTTPGCHDILVFEPGKPTACDTSNGIKHFGFRLRTPEDIRNVRQKIINAGGKITDEGDSCQGLRTSFSETLTITK